MTVVVLFCLPLLNTSCFFLDDDPVEPEGYELKVTVNTAEMYEKLGIADELLATLADEPEKSGVGISLYLYDASGNLVDSEDGVGIRHDLQPIKAGLDDLENGSYTLLVVQAVTYEGEEGSYLDIEKEEKLSTIEMWNRFGREIPATFAFGYKMVKVTISDGDAELTVTPAAAGSVVEFSLAGLDKTDFWEIYLATDGVPFCIAPDDKPGEPDLVREYRTRWGGKAEVAYFDLSQENAPAMKGKFFCVNMAGKTKYQIIGMKADLTDEVVSEGEVDVMLGGEIPVSYDWGAN